MPNYDAIFNNGTLFIGNEENTAIAKSYVYDFSKCCFDKTLIMYGGISENCSWVDVVINKKAFELIGKDFSNLAIFLFCSTESFVKSDNILLKLFIITFFKSLFISYKFLI